MTTRDPAVLGSAKSFRWSLAGKKDEPPGEVELSTSVASLGGALQESTAVDASSEGSASGGCFTSESREQGDFRDVKILGREANAARTSGCVCCATPTFGTNSIATAKCVVL
jgi:hypothetical protein